MNNNQNTTFFLAVLSLLLLLPACGAPPANSAGDSQSYDLEVCIAEEYRVNLDETLPAKIVLTQGQRLMFVRSIPLTEGAASVGIDSQSAVNVLREIMRQPGPLDDNVQLVAEFMTPELGSAKIEVYYPIIGPRRMLPQVIEIEVVAPPDIYPPPGQ